MDAVVKSFEERKFKVGVNTDKDHETYALIHDEKLSFSLIGNFINTLENNSESWAKSKMIRSYIREVGKKVAQRLDRHTFQKEYEKWLSMANQYVDQLDC